MIFNHFKSSKYDNRAYPTLHCIEINSGVWKNHPTWKEYKTGQGQLH